MQKLRVKLKNAPMDASQVHCTASMPLNRVKRFSVASKVLARNNPEENHSQHTGRAINPLVYVLSKEGNPLMPCSQAKANRMLKKGACRVVKRYPFTVRLNFCRVNDTPKVVLGIDSGYENIGFSVVSKSRELISGTVKLDGRTSKRLIERAMYRRLKRNKLWYREARFDNRTRKEGWLPPSIERRYQTHLMLIDRLKRILPITEVVIEVANFDIQKIMNPEIAGADYQKGSLYGYQNMRSFLMAREQGKCQLCNKTFEGQPSHIHHCRQRSEAGSDRVENLAIMHEKCHEKLHKQGLKLSKPKSYKPNTFMSIIRNRFTKDIPDLRVTYGYNTFIKRNELGLKKSHSTDAFVIAGGDGQDRCSEWAIEQKRRNNRSLQINRKGYKPAIRKQRYTIQPKDLVLINGDWKETSGIHCRGARLLVGGKSININEVKDIYNTGNFVWRSAIHPTTKFVGFRAG